MRSLPLFGLGIAVVLAGIALFALTLLKAGATASGKGGMPLKKSELRELEAQRASKQTENTKLRIAGGVCLAIGVVLMVLS